MPPTGGIFKVKLESLHLVTVNIEIFLSLAYCTKSGSVKFFSLVETQIFSGFTKEKGEYSHTWRLIMNIKAWPSA